MSFKRSRRGKFTEFMSDHIFSDIYRNELLPIMNGDRMAHHVRRYRRTPRPGLMNLSLILCVHVGDGSLKMTINEWAFSK
jgi:hypothetical protein